MHPLTRTLIASAALLSILSTPGCLRGSQKPDDAAASAHDPAWPEGYRSWKKVNAEPIVRSEEGVAREIFAKPAAGLGQGTVLVKEQYLYAGGQRGALQYVGVMRRTGAPTAANGGWEFLAFDPATKQQNTAAATTCVGCHSLQADSDYLFTPRDAL